MPNKYSVHNFPITLHLDAVPLSMLVLQTYISENCHILKQICFSYLKTTVIRLRNTGGNMSDAHMHSLKLNPHKGYISTASSID
jgi:hypothetical protein